MSSCEHGDEPFSATKHIFFLLFMRSSLRRAVLVEDTDLQIWVVSEKLTV